MARLDWTQLPPALRARVEEFAGSPVARAQSQDGGFSAGVASRLTFADGRRLFAKAVQESTEGTFALYVREAEVLGAIPRSLPAAHLVDAFTADGWAVLLIEDVEGRHPERSASAPDTVPLLDHPVFAGSTTQDHVALLSAAGGAWFEKCRLPAPDGMTTLRDFQRREAVIATDWIAELLH